MIGQADLADAFLPLLILFIADAQRFRHRVGVFILLVGQHAAEVLFFMHIVEPQPDQHTVVQRFQTAVSLRQFVGGGDQQTHRDRLFAVAVAKATFVDGGEQRIENRRTGFPDLIQKDDFGIRQIAFGQTLIASFIFQRLNRQRAKHLFGRGKTGHQVFKGTGVLEGVFQAAGNQALGDARWPKQKHAFAAQRCQQAETNGMMPFIQPLLQGIAEARNSFCQKMGLSHSHIIVLLILVPSYSGERNTLLFIMRESVDSRQLFCFRRLR